MTDPITDMLNRIRNSQAVFQETVVIPFSKLKFELAKVLENQCFVEKVEKKGKKIKKTIEINLKYKDKAPTIEGMKRISKPGQRIYLPFSKIRRVKGGYGVAVVSTSQGLMTDREARKKKLGGEILCEIW